MEYWKNKSLEPLIEIFEGIEICERWQDIEGYYDLYQISNFGRIKSLPKTWNTWHRTPLTTKTKILSLCKDSDGYIICGLSRNGELKNYKVHRLVAIHFIPNPDNKPEVNHRLGIKADNRFHQLEWHTPSENQLHAFKLGLQKPNKPWLGKTGKDNPHSRIVMQYTVNEEYIKTHYGASDAQRELGIDARGIGLAAKGKIKTFGGFIWKYETNKK